MHGRPAAPQVVVVHRRQIVVDQRIAVHAFDRDAGAQRRRRRRRRARARSRSSGTAAAACRRRARHSASPPSAARAARVSPGSASSARAASSSAASTAAPTSARRRAEDRSLESVSHSLDRRNRAGSKTRLTEQNSQVTPIMPSSPTIAARSSARKALQHRVDLLGRAAAGLDQRRRLGDAHAALVEQAEQQPFARQRRIDQLVILGRRRRAIWPRPIRRPRATARRASRPRARRRDRRSTWRRRSGESGRNCASRPPARHSRAFGRHALPDREPHQRRDLLGALEIGVRGLLEPLALERDHALIARGEARPPRW